MRLKRHWVNVVLLCAGLLLGSLSASAINPVARTESVVRSGNMRFTILTSRMIRIEQSNNGNFENRATMAIVNRVLVRDPAAPEDLLATMVKWPDNANTKAWFYLDVQEATNSHYYERETKGTEVWTEIRANRDWSQLQ